MKVPSAFFLVLAVLFWSGNYVLGRAVVGTIPPITLAYIRWILALLLFLPFVWRELQDNREMAKAHWQAFAIMGLTGFLGFNFFQYLAVKYTTAINATIINASLPMFTAIAGYLFLQDKLKGYQLLGIALSFTGVLTVITRGQVQNLFKMAFNKGDLIMFLAVFSNTAYLIYLKKKGFLVPPKTLFACAVMGGLAVTLPVPLLEIYLVGLDWLRLIGGIHYLSLLYFALFPSIISMLFFNRAIVDLGPVRTAIYLNLSIVFSSILGTFFLEESLTFTHLIGGAFIVTGVLLTNRPAGAKAAENLQVDKRTGD